VQADVAGVDVAGIFRLTGVLQALCSFGGYAVFGGVVCSNSRAARGPASSP